MLKLLPLSFLLFSQVALSYSFKCTGLYNTETIMETEVQLSAGDSNVKFASFDGLDFLLSFKADSKVELQSYNYMEPSRTYASAVMSDVGNHVSLIVWKRESILDVQCIRIK